MRHVKDGFTNVKVKFGGLNQCLSVKVVHASKLIDDGNEEVKELVVSKKSEVHDKIDRRIRRRN